MVSIKENKAWWDKHYDWEELGDEWSRPWGDAATQWYGSILPRVHRFLPAPNILEIGCGFGRWTQFLKDQCEQLTALDLAENCVAACKQRFSEVTNITYLVNDGSSLDAIADSSIDFVFSFDSLVHADSSTMEAYLAQLPRILTADGVAFMHHSNLGAYRPGFRRLAGSRSIERVLRRLGVIEYLHVRDPSMSAQHLAAYGARLGLQCIAQELTTWHTRRTWIDCMSTIVRADGPHARENRVLRNAGFRREAAYLKGLSTLYGPERPRPDGHA
jgi:ubiquinone/menaquinone biosynthesis C-methylase UbiE